MGKEFLRKISDPLCKEYQFAEKSAYELPLAALARIRACIELLVDISIDNLGGINSGTLSQRLSSLRGKIPGELYDEIIDVRRLANQACHSVETHHEKSALIKQTIHALFITFSYAAWYFNKILKEGIAPEFTEPAPISWEQLITEAHDGIPEAAYIVGRTHFYKSSNETDKLLAKAFLHLAFSKNYYSSAEYLARIYQYDKPTQSLKYANIAIEYGFTYGMYELKSSLYTRLEKPTESLNALIEGANKGDPIAMSWLGQRMMASEAGTIDFPKSEVELLRDAWELCTHPEVGYHLAIALHDTIGTKQSIEEAIVVLKDCYDFYVEHGLDFSVDILMLSEIYFQQGNREEATQVLQEIGNQGGWNSFLAANQFVEFKDYLNGFKYLKNYMNSEHHDNDAPYSKRLTQLLEKLIDQGINDISREAFNIYSAIKR